MLRRMTQVLLLATLCSLPAFAGGKQFFPDNQIPMFNIPKMKAAPTIDGNIKADEWKTAVRIMGMATAHNNRYRGRPHVFWVSWDAKHIYIAGRAHVLKGHILGKSRREKYTTGTVFDDAFEFGLGMEGRNQQPGEVPSFFKFILNFLKAGEYLKMYPSIGQYLYNWRPELDMATKLEKTDDAQYFNIEIALDLKDLEMPVENKAGDLIKILLAHDGKNPGWQWTCVPSATGYLVHTGYPRGTLTKDRPYLQMEQLDGFDDEKLNLKSTLYNPTDKPQKVKVELRIGNQLYRGRGEFDPTTAVKEEKELVIPANDSIRYDVQKQFAGLTGKRKNKSGRHDITVAGNFSLRITRPGLEENPVYRYHLVFQKDTKKAHLQYTAKDLLFNMKTRFNPVSCKIWIEADTLDAKLPKGVKPAGINYTVKLGDKEIQTGRIKQYIYYKFQDLIQLPQLGPGKYDITIDMVDETGKVLLTRNATFAKKDEAKEFPEWWGKKFGNPEQLLRPFEALKVKQAFRGKKTEVTCVRRTYFINSLGLPNQITANSDSVLTGPARIIVTVDGIDHEVPVTNKLNFTEKKDWRVRFEGAASVAAGISFQAKGMMEQDGLVSLELTYKPVRGSVNVQELKIEWPVDDTFYNHIACMGVGGNYSARYIDVIPAGQGVVWSSKKHIGKAGSGMSEGNFFQNLWIGTEKRGLLWYGTSDEGWVPNDKLAAHDIVRDRNTTIIRNHIIGTHPTEKPFKLSKARTIKFSYNASPFKKLTKGWRINQRSAANGFTKKPKYKWNWDTGKEYFSVLSPPFPKRDKWDEYYKHCAAVGAGMEKQGIYGPGIRMRPYLTNQIALRGYMRKSLENHIYNYFSADWETSDSGETLNESYQDYMMWLQHLQVTKGGCRHFYYDISMCGRISRAVVADMGYILPDGRIQPSGTDWTLRQWYIRANALMQENGLYPTGISGHATNTIPLVALPFSDAILDSEFPMKDPITVFPMHRMIALSVPQNFGCNINHLGFMNPNWAAMHDAGMGGGHSSVFDRPEWRNWGIEREDVEFIPYWRNQKQVRRIGDGLICSMWRRPRSVILGIMNYGLDKEGFEKTRPCELTLNLQALGIPQDARAEMVRASEITRNHLLSKYVTHFKWYKDLPGKPHPYRKGQQQKWRPKAEPKLDLKTGALTGFDIFYHDQRYIVINWENKPVDDSKWKEDLPDDYRTAALNWGINNATEITGRPTVKSNGKLKVRAWRRDGSVLLMIENATDKSEMATINVDVDALGLKVQNLWEDFCSSYALNGGSIRNVVFTKEFEEKQKHHYTRGALVYDGHQGLVKGLVHKGKKFLISIDKY